MTILLGALLLAASLYDTARLLAARRPRAVERRLTRALLAGRLAPALYQRRMALLAHGPTRARRETAGHAANPGRH